MRYSCGACYRESIESSGHGRRTDGLQERNDLFEHELTALQPLLLRMPTGITLSEVYMEEAGSSRSRQSPNILGGRDQADASGVSLIPDSSLK